VRLELEAELGWSLESLEREGYSEYDQVTVSLGGTAVAVLPLTAAPSRAGHGDDSTYFKAEERRMVEETVAPFLRRLFEAGP
jgi:hypothetical protein